MLVSVLFVFTESVPSVFPPVLPSVQAVKLIFLCVVVLHFLFYFGNHFSFISSALPPVSLPRIARCEMLRARVAHEQEAVSLQLKSKKSVTKSEET